MTTNTGDRSATRPAAGVEEPPDPINMAQIARLVGVGRAAVANWRRRHDDFPQQVGGDKVSPTFALAEVQAWLTAHGKVPWWARHTFADQTSPTGG